MKRVSPVNQDVFLFNTPPLSHPKELSADTITSTMQFISSLPNCPKHAFYLFLKNLGSNKHVVFGCYANVILKTWIINLIISD